MRGVSPTKQPQTTLGTLNVVCSFSLSTKTIFYWLGQHEICLDLNPSCNRNPMMPGLGTSNSTGLNDIIENKRKTHKLRRTHQNANGNRKNNNSLISLFDLMHLMIMDNG
ncbi:hypothetical protein V1477_001228 [Vespula maculifrons]|uniref:Uncharacterized protein n=1 Tax=Vespula maculifrons TaxID=7453 RepID=A0ABD2D234_VESMC